MVNYEKIRPGYDLWLESVFHDSGEYSNAGGGKTTGYFSLPGMGKSTLLCIATQITSSFPGKQNKGAFIKAQSALLEDPGNKDLLDIIQSYVIEPETCIWRIRDSDGFANLIKPNWDRSFRGNREAPLGKPFHIWVHEKDADTVFFYCIDEKYNVVPVKNIPQIEYYHDAVDLISNLHIGCINAVLEPQTYKLSSEMISRLKEKKMEINDEYETELKDRAIRAEDRADRAETGRKPGRPKGTRSRSKRAAGTGKYEQMEIAPAYFWFDLIHTALKWNRRRHITFVIDEWDDVAEARSEGNAWKFIDILANDWKSLRRNNISAYLTTHQTDFVDWRILKRMEYKIWMRGAIVKDAWSMISQQELISGLDIGRYIIEYSKIRFGLCPFPKIPHSQPSVNIDGLKGQQRFLKPKEMDRLMKAMEAAPDPMEAAEA